MKKLAIIYLGLLFVMIEINPILAQSKSNYQDMLERYWYYRYRLKKQFVLVSPYNELGTNIPACIHCYRVLSCGK
jgi:hypothetical protein